MAFFFAHDTSLGTSFVVFLSYLSSKIMFLHQSFSLSVLYCLHSYH